MELFKSTQGSLQWKKVLWIIKMFFRPTKKKVLQRTKVLCIFKHSLIKSDMATDWCLWKHYTVFEAGVLIGRVEEWQKRKEVSAQGLVWVWVWRWISEFGCEHLLISSEWNLISTLISSGVKQHTFTWRRIISCSFSHPDLNNHICLWKSELDKTQ